MNGVSLLGPSCLRTVRAEVENLMACPTKRNQVGLCVVTKGTSSSHVVNIEILGASTFLTSPTITLQNFSTQLRI